MKRMKNTSTMQANKKKMWNIKVTVIPITNGAVIKDLMQGVDCLDITKWVETTQATASLRSARILRRVLETCGDLLSLKLQWEITNKRWCKKLSWGNRNNSNSNCYCRRKWTRRHEFKSWTRLIVFHIALIPLGKVWIQLFSLQLWVNSRTD